jgi:hypothetical protein
MGAYCTLFGLTSATFNFHLNDVSDIYLREILIIASALSNDVKFFGHNIRPPRCTTSLTLPLLEKISTSHPRPKAAKLINDVNSINFHLLIHVKILKMGVR